MDILFASNNAGKLREIKAAFEPKGITIVSLNEIGLVDFDVEESGQTYAENACIKAKTAYERTGLPSIGDDSGLEVDYLGGAPGIYSRRWWGDEDPCQKMIRTLENVPFEKRTAQYLTTLCFYNGMELYVDDIVHGRLLDEVRGNKGFAFDGIFLPDGYNLTFGELDIDIKNKISARGKAAEKMAHIISAEAEA